MKKKGFTLIELLAVIVILAVIALIATPAVLNVIEDSKKSAAEASARNIVSAAKTHYMQNIMDNKENTNVDLSTNTLKYDGEQAKKGILNYDENGNITGKMYISGYCIEITSDGSITSEKVSEKDCSIGEPTDLSCFTIEGTTITDYKCYAGNTYGLPTIKDVVIPNSVTTIGWFAFAENYLTNVTIPNSVTTIGDYAFEKNQLTNVTIPNSVTIIEDNAFSYNQLTSVTIGNSVTTIGDNAFADNRLTSVTISNSVTSIGDYAFADNRLTSVTIPNSVISIGGGAFNNNMLPDNQAYIYKRTDTNKDGIAEIDTTKVVSYGGTKKDIIIPTSITTIDRKAFAQNQLTSVVIPNSVTTIGWEAFRGNRLTSVTIPNSVTTIDFWAFAYNQLTSVTIPNSVTTIGSLAFLSNKLTNIEIPDSVTYIGGGAFSNNMLPDSQAYIYARTDTNKDGIAEIDTTTLVSHGGAKKDIIIPTSITTIGDNAFFSNRLTNVTIPNSVTTIGNSAFFDNRLTSVTIPNSVTTIENSAFSSNQLTSVTIGNSVTTIGVNAFSSNSSLKTITIDNTSGSISGSPWGAASATIKYLR